MLGSYAGMVFLQVFTVFGLSIAFKKHLSFLVLECRCHFGFSSAEDEIFNVN